jgi:tetratricopeptide (TPR) repeat protein
MTVTAIAAVVLGVLSFRQSGAYVDSETLYRATIAENPSCWLCENNLAVALLSSRPPRVMDAIVHARRAVTLRADYADAHGNLATGLERDGQWQAALNEYQRAEHGYADAPDDVRLGGVYHGIGRMLVQLGRPGDALPAYDAALRLQPASVDLRVNAGVAFGSAGQDERAEREFRAAIALDPNSAHAHSDLGAALMKQQRFDDAIRELNAAIALDAQNPDTRFNLGIASERVGDHTRAIAAFKAALALDPRCASCVAHLRALGR